MKIQHMLLPLLISGCADYHKNGLKVSQCYIHEDEAIKIVGLEGQQYYYKHSWNDQKTIFHGDMAYSIWDKQESIPCDRSGYEFEVMVYKIRMAEKDIDYLMDLTLQLRKTRK